MLRKRNNKRSLYESIIRDVDKIVKKHLNECFLINEVSAGLLTRAAAKAREHGGAKYERLAKEFEKWRDSHEREELMIKQAIQKNKVRNYHPKDRYELHELIKLLLDERGKDADLNDINTSHITDMSDLFCDLDPHNIKIDKWDVSHVKNMDSMFWFCKNFTGNGLENWDVSNVETMFMMFHNCYKLDCDLSKWNVSNVKNMHGMFSNCYTFNSDLSNWNTSNVETMFMMFAGCKNFNSNLSNWNTSRVKQMGDMFKGSRLKLKYRPKNYSKLQQDYLQNLEPW